MSPVLLDQKRLLVIIVGVLCALLISFYSGYFAGIHKAEASLPQVVERLELNLPDAPAPEPERSEALAPEVTVPGADIDVDAVDAQPESPAPEQAVSSTEVARARAPLPTADEAGEIRPDSHPTPEADPETIPPIAPPQPIEPTEPPFIQPPESPDGDPGILIVDDASRDEARYSIQVGIYGSLNNAEHQVASLVAQDLSASYEAYQNQKDETRYRVRFGYFASHASASRALALWQKIHPGSSGYLVQLTD